MAFPGNLLSTPEVNPIPGNRSQRKLSRGRLLAYRLAVLIGTGIVELPSRG